VRYGNFLVIFLENCAFSSFFSLLYPRKTDITDMKQPQRGICQPTPFQLDFIRLLLDAGVHQRGVNSYNKERARAHDVLSDPNKH
jgi:hypothetical protein